MCFCVSLLVQKTPSFEGVSSHVISRELSQPEYRPGLFSLTKQDSLCPQTWWEAAGPFSTVMMGGPPLGPVLVRIQNFSGAPVRASALSWEDMETDYSIGQLVSLKLCENLSVQLNLYTRPTSSVGLFLLLCPQMCTQSL